MIFNYSLFLATAALVMTAGCSAASEPVTTTTITTCDLRDTNVQRLSCEQGVISVLTVLFGRLDRRTCTEGHSSSSELADTDCVHHRAKQILQKRCDGKSSCEVAIYLFNSDDPCFGIFKYLETTYACVGSFQRPSKVRVVACQDSIAHLRCEEGKVIQISSASYGRQDNVTCSFELPLSQHNQTDCASSVTHYNVYNRCNGRSVCSVKATNSVFGEPCFGTYNYLQVDYSCQKPSV